jgi:hypothetical protein
MDENGGVTDCWSVCDYEEKYTRTVTFCFSHGRATSWKRCQSPESKRNHVEAVYLDVDHLEFPLSIGELIITLIGKRSFAIPIRNDYFSAKWSQD